MEQNSYFDGDWIYDEDDMASACDCTGIVPSGIDQNEADNYNHDFHLRVSPNKCKPNK